MKILPPPHEGALDAQREILSEGGDDIDGSALRQRLDELPRDPAAVEADLADGKRTDRDSE